MFPLIIGLLSLIALIVLTWIYQHRINSVEHQLDLEEQNVEHLLNQRDDLYGLVALLERKVETGDRVFNLVADSNEKLSTTVQSMTTTHDMLIAELEDRNKEIAHILLGAFTDDTPIPFVPADEVVEFPNGGKLTLVNEHPLWVHDDGTACPTVTFPSADFGGVCLRHGLPVHIPHEDDVSPRTWGDRMSDLGVSDESIVRLLSEVRPDDN